MLSAGPSQFARNGGPQSTSDRVRHAVEGGGPSSDPPTLDQILLARLAGFVAFLRENGFVVGVDDSAALVDTASRIGILDSQLLRWSARALICRRAGDLQRFDELFDAWFLPPNRRKWVESRGGGRGALGNSSATANGADEGSPALQDNGAGTQEPEGSTARQGASFAEALAEMDFRHLHQPEEVRALEVLMRRLALRLRKLTLRRERSGGARRIDFPATSRRSVSHGGDPIELAFLERRRVPPRLVLLLDVSRSMNLYSFFFLRLARALQGVHLSTRVFIWHTRLSPVTEALRDADPWRAQERLQLLSAGWAGGTRIGECLGQFEREYGHTLNSRTGLVVVSDGYDTGEPELLAGVMRRLRRRVRRVIWLNPLAGRDGYLPLARGMKAAFPYIDLLAPAHNLATVDRVLPRLVLALR